jgi:hypothetical protein
VPAAFKISGHKNTHHFFHVTFPYKSCRDTNNIGIIMCAGQLGQFFTPTDRGTDALVFIGSDSYTIGASILKYQKPLFCLPLH